MTTIDISIASETDDGFLYPTTDGPLNFFSTDANIVLGNNNPGSGARVSAGWFRFIVPVPNSAIISSAYMTNYRVSCNPTVRLRIYAEDQDNPDATSDPADFYAASLTTDFVDWDPSSTDFGAVFNGPEIKTVVQEIVDRPGWAPNNALQLLVRDDGSSADNKLLVAAFESSDPEPVLHIEFIGGGEVIMWTSE